MRRLDDQKAINSVYGALKSQGKALIEEPAFDDNPDWVFELEGRRIAADCTCINLEQIMKWSRSERRLEPGKQYEIKFAFEPHYWIAKAVEDKEPKIAQYKKNSGAEEVWLIAHSEFDGQPLYECKQPAIDIMRDAVRSLNTSFARVWFVHSEYGSAELWQAGDPITPSFPNWIVNDEYPSYTVVQFRQTITKDGLNMTIQFGSTDERVVLQPINTQYSLD